MRHRRAKRQPTRDIRQRLAPMLLQERRVPRETWWVWEYKKRSSRTGPGWRYVTKTRDRDEAEQIMNRLANERYGPHRELWQRNLFSVTGTKNRPDHKPWLPTWPGHPETAAWRDPDKKRPRDKAKDLFQAAVRKAGEAKRLDVSPLRPGASAKAARAYPCCREVVRAAFGQKCAR